MAADKLYKYKWPGILLACTIVVCGIYWWWCCWRCSCSPPTTAIVVRHAERASSPPADPPLTAAGQARANDLYRAVSDVGIDGIFATEFQRTKLSVQPTATGTGLTTQVVSAADTSTMVNNIFANYRGGAVLVAGHSNTVPTIVELLGGGVIEPISEDDFDNMYIVTNHGRCGTHVLRLHYGDAD